MDIADPTGYIEILPNSIQNVFICDLVTVSLKCFFLLKTLQGHRSILGPARHI
jgi:hypothetical protein